MKHLNQRGFAVLELLLILVVIGILGFVGYRAIQARNLPEVSDYAPILSSSKTYQNKEFGFKLSYPKSWGDAKFAKGEVVSPGQGDYMQLTFSKQPMVNVNFVLGHFGSPLDGCPGAVFSEKHFKSQLRASVTGWQGEAYKTYQTDYDNFDQETRRWLPKYFTHVLDPPKEFGHSLTKVGVSKAVLAFEHKDQNYWQETPPEKYCDPDGLSKEDAETANSYRKVRLYALNYSNLTIKGINAQYDTNNGLDIKTHEQIMVILNSVKRI